MYGIQIQTFKALYCSRLQYSFNLSIEPIISDHNLCFDYLSNDQIKVSQVLTDPHTGKALVIANQSRNVRSNIKRSVNSAVRAAYRSLAAFFIDLRPK